LPSDGQSETAIVRWNDLDVIAAWNDGTGFHDGSGQIQGWATSTDGGATWTDRGTLPVPAAYPTWKWSSDPVLAINTATGAVYYTGLGDVGTSLSAVGVIKGRFATDGTFTWDPPSAARVASTTTDFLDKEWIAVEPTTGRVYLSYTDFAPNSDIIFQWADSALVTWSAPQQLSLAAESGYVQGSRPAAGPGGNVYLMYYLIGPVDADYYRICRSTDAGVSFATPVDAVSFYTNYGTGAPGFNRDAGIQFASIAVDRSGGAHDGRVYLAWNESLNWYADFGQLAAGTSRTEREPNDSAAVATPFTRGQTLRGTLTGAGDFDWYAVHLAAGEGILVECDSIASAFFYDPYYKSGSMSLRMFARDGRTRLCYTTVSSGDVGTYSGTTIGPMWTFVAPEDGTYYVRVASPGPAGAYRLRTAAANHGTERGRDQRDAFVSTFDPGGSWSTPERVSNSPPGYDDWLPEVAVGPDGVAYCAWYDWRDAAAGTSGGESNVDMAVSGDGGANWSELGPMSSARSPWTWVNSNIQPNEGDYLSVFANASGATLAWSDGRSGNPDVYAQRLPAGEPVSAGVVIAADHVDLKWFVDAPPGYDAALSRRVGLSGAYTAAGTLTSDAARLLHFTDTDVAPGGTYSYQLVHNGITYGPITLTIPTPVVHVELAVNGAWPNPATNAGTIAFTLSSSDPATLELVDVTGRKVQSRDVSAFGAGPHQVPLADGGRLRPGIYFVRLQQGGLARTKRIVVL
jgi:hypothetical protein